MLVVKLALLITLIGGTSHEASKVEEEEVEGSVKLSVEDDDGEELEMPVQFSLRPSLNNNGNKSKKTRSKKINSSRRRAQSHILLVGDPGTGKSQFLRFAAALSPRSVLTTGVGTTSAGLTCAAVKTLNNNEYTLEAGALVLADRGVCCIDEFGCIRAEDRNNIHEAMEQQTLSVAKAGIVCKLNTRATVVAVMNPKRSLYDLHDSVSKNTNIGCPLLSRFDFILVLLDVSDLERDDKITTFLLKQGLQDKLPYNKSSSTPQQQWSKEKLRCYIALVKETFQPTLTKPAALLLQRHYKSCRSKPSSIQITVRFLESLIRLSQAHARLMYRNTVTLMDAAAVVLLMECSAATTGGFEGVGISVDLNDYLYKPPMQSEFPLPEEADDDFMKDCYILLRRYNMLEYLPRKNNDNDNNTFAVNTNNYTVNNHVDCWGRQHFSQRQSKRAKI